MRASRDCCEHGINYHNTVMGGVNTKPDINVNKENGIEIKSREDQHQ